MVEHEPDQEAELSNCEVRDPGGLLAFKAANADTHMGSCDHVDVVAAVTNRESFSFRVLLFHHKDDFGLLFGRYATCDHDRNTVN